jgi:hypothetical protein
MNRINDEDFGDFEYDGDFEYEVFFPSKTDTALARYEPTEYDGMVPVSDGEWVKWGDAKRCLDAIAEAEKMLCEQENALRLLGADEPNAESAILTLRFILSNTEVSGGEPKASG